MVRNITSRTSQPEIGFFCREEDDNGGDNNRYEEGLENAPSSKHRNSPISRTLKSAQISTKFHPLLSRMMRAEKKRTVSSNQHHDNIAETKDTTREGRSWHHLEDIPRSILISKVATCISCEDYEKRTQMPGISSERFSSETKPQLFVIIINVPTRGRGTNRRHLRVSYYLLLKVCDWFRFFESVLKEASVV